MEHFENVFSGDSDLLEPVVLVDANNYAIIQYHTWVKEANKTAREFCQNLVASLPQETEFWFDGAGYKDVVRKLWPEYKRKREERDPDPELGYFLGLFREATGNRFFTEPQVEADRLVARRALEISKSGRKVTILSKDRDLWQIGDSPNISLPLITPPSYLPRDCVLYKTLVGDSSDNIPGLKGFGDKAFEKLDEAEKLSLSLFLKSGSETPYPFGKYILEGEVLVKLRNFMKIVDLFSDL